MTIDEAVDSLELFDVPHPAPSWRWYKGLLGVQTEDELRLYKANVAAGLGG